MTNKYEIIGNIGLSLVYIVLTLVALSPMVLASSLEPDIYDLWNNISEFEEVASLRAFLVENDWADENLSVEDLDYILVLTRQCSDQFFPTVPTSLVLAMISVESGFRQDLTGFSDDTGLMQVIPKYHRERIEKYIYEENIDLYDQRLNIMVAMDYLEELFEESRGDIEFVVMAYNMGPNRAWSCHNKGVVSSYAKQVLYRMNAITSFLERRS